MGKLDVNSSRAPYLQVADSVLRTIREGDYRPGDPLPSYKDLATEYGVAVGTAKNAVNLLRERGLVVTRHGAGSTVHPDLDVSTLATDVESVREPGMAEVLALLGDIRDRLDSIETKLSPR